MYPESWLKRMSKVNRKTRYVTPFLLFAVGWYIAYELITRVTEGMPPTGFLSPFMATPDLGTDLAVIMAIGIPILAIEYLLLAVPGAAAILFITRIYKAPSYEMNVMNIGREFGTVKMIKRSVAPALFSLAFAGTFLDVVEQLAFGTTNPTAPAGYADVFPAIETLMGALVFMFISLALFMPTWLLNDTGVVTNIKPAIMKTRRCPDTQGVGRWISNILGGYGLIAYPLFAFRDYFYDLIIVPFLANPTNYTFPIFQGLISLLFTLGLPFIMMAFIMPVVVLNEALLGRMTSRVGNIAKRLGARPIRKEVIQVDKRTTAGMQEEEMKPNLAPSTNISKEVVSSAKTVKRGKKKEKKTKKKKTK